VSAKFLLQLALCWLLLLETHRQALLHREFQLEKRVVSWKYLSLSCAEAASELD
jgi:hypothetical protein